jgi:hypothetical protein
MRQAIALRVDHAPAGGAEARVEAEDFHLLSPLWGGVGVGASRVCG